MEIRIHNKSVANANGTHTRGNCKPIFCITTGEIYTSVTDAAEKIGVTVSAMSSIITGKTKTCNGKRFCYVSKLTEHIEEISESINQKTDVYNEYTNWHRANAKVAQHKANCDKLRQRLEREMKMLEMAETEVKSLKENNNMWRN